MRRAALLLVLAAASAAAAGCGRGDDHADRPDPLADRGEPRTQLVATVATVPAGTSLVADVERRVAEVQRRRIAAGTLEGPLRRVRCTTRERPGDGTTVLDCLAVRAEGGGAIIGTPYLARLDPTTRRIAWCDFTLVAGEGATPGASEYRPPAPACGGALPRASAWSGG